MKGIFYNSRYALCSIWESGKMCYNILCNSSKYTLDYSEESYIDNSYDFIIINYHYTTNSWITQQMVNNFNKKTFCIVLEVGLGIDPLTHTPKIFDHYIVLDPTINEMHDIHAFSRPLENIKLNNIESQNNIVKIGSFGFATYGKEWHKIVECVQNEFDEAEIYINIPKATFVPQNIHDELINDLKNKVNNLLIKPKIVLKITHEILTKEEIVNFCNSNTINIFFYNRSDTLSSGLAAVTDQAIISEKPILVSDDLTFRHIHKYIDYYPNISIKDAIIKNKDGVKQMKIDWSSDAFLSKFENILYLHD